MSPKYTITELGTPEGDYSEARGINHLSEVVGRAAFPRFLSEACLWKPSEAVVELGAPWTGVTQTQPRVLTSVAESINAQGKVVGWTQKGSMDSRHALLYDGGPVDLTSVLGTPFSMAFDINSNDVIVGTRADASGQTQAFVCDLKSGKVIDLPVAETITTGATANAINDAGDVAGGTYRGPPIEGWQAFVVHGGQVTLLTGILANGQANDVNASGQVVGGVEVFDISEMKPFIYDTLQGLKMLEVELGVATAINDFGVVVGTGSKGGKPFAWRYTTEEGVVDLDTAVPPGGNWKLSAAFDINNLGEIVGRGEHEGKPRGFLLSPVVREERPPWRWGWRLPLEISIDPIALILSGRAYDIVTQIHHPHEPTVAEVREVLRSMTDEERIAVLNRARALARYATTVEAAFALVKK
jgi:uncharacterized membrane protein